MNLKFLETYKKFNIYQDDNTGNYIVYNDKDPILSKKIVRNTIGLFVKNNIPVNMNILSYSTTKQTSYIDIDINEILNRSNIKFFQFT